MGSLIGNKNRRGEKEVQEEGNKGRDIYSLSKYEF